MGRKKKPDSEKATKPGVSLNPETRGILSKIAAYENEVHKNDLAQAQIIRKCIRIAWEMHYENKCSDLEKETRMGLLSEEPGKDAAPECANVIRPSENSVGGCSTPTVVNYRQGGRRK